MNKKETNQKNFKLRLFIATLLRKFRVFKFKLMGYDLTYSTIIEGTVRLDKLYPKGIHIGEFTSSSVIDTTVPLIIKSSGSVEIETYAMSMADHNAAFGVIPEPTE